MRIFVGESGAITTRHDPNEFRLLRSYVSFGNLFYSARRGHYDQPGADYIGPLVSTPESASYLARVAELGVASSIENSTLARDVLESGRPDTDSPDMTLVDWRSDNQVSAVRSRLLRGMFEDGEFPSVTDQSPGNSLYDALRVVEQVLRLPVAEAVARATLFNDTAALQQVDARVA